MDARLARRFLPRSAVWWQIEAERGTVKYEFGSWLATMINDVLYCVESAHFFAGRAAIFERRDEEKNKV